MHDSLYLPEHFDRELKETLVEFENKGFLDNTLLILTSDHGHRLSKYYYETDYGQIELSSPLLNMRLPKKLRNSAFYQNAYENRNKLISIFDLYKTIRHFNYINKFNVHNNHEHYNDGRLKCNDKFRKNDIQTRSLRGISIFESIDENRNCLEALIPLTLCTCNLKSDIDEATFKQETKYDFLNVSTKIVDELNKMTELSREKCHEFKFKNVVNVKKVILNRVLFYQFRIMVQPGSSTTFEANFRAKLEYFNYDNTKKIRVTLSLYDKIKRLSKYGNQSKCVTELHLQGFCYCKSKSNQT